MAICEKKIRIILKTRGVSFDWAEDDGTLAPTAAGGSLPFAPEICIPALKAMHVKYETRRPKANPDAARQQKNIRRISVSSASLGGKFFAF